MSATTMLNKPASEPGLSLLDGLTCVYLVLPLLLFCTWFKWPVALGLGLLTCYGFAQASPGVQLRRLDLSRRAIVLIAVVALAWTALTGVGHFFFANSDWVIRDAVLRDLVATPWPPMYDAGTGNEAAQILRAPVGFYLPVAVAGSLLGLRCADILLYLWTAFGFALVLWAAATLFTTRRERVLSVLLMLLFGGLDLIGFALMKGKLPALGQHVEWWASFAQYSGNSTLMFWVPNHALPAWLGLLLALRHWRTRELARMALMLAAAISLWSPLSAVGLVPFFLAGLNWRRDLGVLLAVRSGLPFLALAALVSRYITLDTQAIARGWAINMFPNAQMFWTYYGAFCMLEFGVLALLLAWLRAIDVRVMVGVLILVALPFCSFGGGNDLVMRASIPALAVLALAAVRPLAASDRPLARFLLGLVLTIGALGAAQEPVRALLTPRWALTGKTLAQVSFEQHAFGLTQLPTNYVGHLNQPGLQALMRQPSMVVPYPDASSKVRP
jgi:hypothetical protein